MHPFEIVSSGEVVSTIAIECPSCGKTSLLEVSNAGLRAREAGALIQVAFPAMTPDDRELFVSGLCAACFPKPPEDDDEMFECDDADDCEDDDCDGCDGCEDCDCEDEDDDPAGDLDADEVEGDGMDDDPSNWY